MPWNDSGVNLKPYNTRMAKHPDVAVIGGGIIGLTAAYFLAKAGLRVEVLDRADLAREASWAGAGILPPGNPARAVTPLDRLRAIGSTCFAAFSEELRERTGIDNGYRLCGGLEFLQPEDEYVLPLWKAEGIAFERLSAEALAHTEPALGRAPGDAYALFACAQVRNPWHLRALIAACETMGVTLAPHTRVCGWHTSNGKIQALGLDGSRTLAADRYVIAAGAWSAEFVPDTLIHPVRGQIVLFNPGRVLFSRVLMAGKRYLVPRGDGRVLVGSTEEPEAGFEKANTEEGMSRLKRFAIDLVPALANAPVEKCWAGLRPGSRDGMPFITALPQWNNAFLAAGHFRAGVQLSLGTAQLLTEMMLGQPTCVPIDVFSLNRQVDERTRPAFRS